MFTTALFTEAKTRKQLRCPSIDEDAVYALWNITRPSKRVSLPSATTWTELEAIMLSEISPSEKDKHRMISYTCGT